MIAPKPDFLLWGLTGGIASGKSTVAQIFSESGIPVIDADALAREIRSPGGAAHNEVVKTFGTADPSTLREKVFGSPLERKKLEAILHPYIEKESLKRAARLAAESKLARPVPVLYEAALLIETGRHERLAGLISVIAGRKTQRTRLIERSGFSETLIESILDAQVSDQEREQKSDFVIDNSGERPELKPQVDSVIASILN